MYAVDVIHLYVTCCAPNYREMLSRIGNHTATWFGCKFLYARIWNAQIRSAVNRSPEKTDGGKLEHYLVTWRQFYAKVLNHAF